MSPKPTETPEEKAARRAHRAHLSARVQARLGQIVARLAADDERAERAALGLLRALWAELRRR